MYINANRFLLGQELTLDLIFAVLGLYVLIFLYWWLFVKEVKKEWQ